MNKKAIAILGAIFILIVGTLGFLIYSKYGGSKAVTPPVSSGNNTAPTSTTVAAGSNSNPGQAATTTPTSTPAQSNPPIVQLISDQVASPVMFYNGKGITYFDNQGQLYQATFTDASASPLQVSSKQSLGIQTRANISKILWPDQGDNYIAQISNNGATSWSFFDSGSRTYKDLPAQVESVSWMPGGTQILYVWLDNGKATLNIGSPDTTNWKYVSDMWETDDAISASPDGKNILYFEQNTSSSTNPINLTTPDGKLWKTLVKDGYNSGALWSPDSQKFLFNRRGPDGRMQLWVYDLSSGNPQNLGVNTTVDKAAWSPDSLSIYAAVPTTGTAGTGNLTTDAFYKLDPSGLNPSKQYSTGQTAVDGRNLFLSLDGNKIFFKNAQDGALYYLDLSAQ